MNTTIITDFGKNLSTGSYGYNPNLPETCWSGTKYSIECIYDVICPQINHHFVKTGLIIVITYIIISWVKWWFLNHGYKKFDKTAHLTREDRLYYNTWIMDRIIMVSIVYISMVVYLSW